MGAAEIAIESHGPVAFSLGETNVLTWSEILHAVREKIGMGVAEDERPEFHDGDEAGEVEDLGVRVSAVEDAREVEKLGPLIDFCPEALFKGLFGCANEGGFFDKVEVGEDADDFGKAMRLEDVEEFKCFLR